MFAPPATYYDPVKALVSFLAGLTKMRLKSAFQHSLRKAKLSVA
jgi:hypothetical protein